jgi:hypothetical protein
MEPADARLSASIMTSSSIRLSLTGVEVGCTTKQFTPRMFSRISTYTSPSAKRVTCAWPSGVSRCRQIASASPRWALPLNMLKALSTTKMPKKVPRNRARVASGLARRRGEYCHFDYAFVNVPGGAERVCVLMPWRFHLQLTTW